MTMHGLVAAAVHLKLGDVEGAIWASARDEAAQLVHTALGHGDVAFADVRAHIPLLWQSTDYPCRRLSYRTWLAWFRNAALPMPALPEAPLRAWRAQVGDELGMSWSYDRSVAERFHDQNVACGYFGARLLCADIPESAIVWHIADPESELIVNPERFGSTWARELLVWGTEGQMIGRTEAIVGAALQPSQ